MANKLEKWDLHWLQVAKTISLASQDPSTKIGAVIVDAKNRLVSTGYNGFPRGVADSPERYDNRELKYRMVVHAETNAILFSQRNLSSCVLYVNPGLPCARCATNIIQVGIKRIVCQQPDEAFMERWKDEMEVASMMYKDAGTNLVVYGVKG